MTDKPEPLDLSAFDGHTPGPWTLGRGSSRGIEFENRDQSSLIDVAHIGIDKGTGPGLRIAAAALAALDIREYEKI